MKSVPICGVHIPPKFTINNGDGRKISTLHLTHNISFTPSIKLGPQILSVLLSKFLPSYSSSLRQPWLIFSNPLRVTDTDFSWTKEGEQQSVGLHHLERGVIHILGNIFSDHSFWDWLHTDKYVYKFTWVETHCRCFVYFMQPDRIKYRTT